MKAKTTNYAKATMLLVVFAILISVAGASAQTAVFFGKFTLTHQVRWGDAMLPAGDYSIRFTSIYSPATVHSMDGKISAYVFTARRGDSEKGPSSLTIVTRGNERRVASMNLPEARISLVYSPLTKAEQETLAKTNQLQTVPLITAKK
jgi:hypothetical protein